MILVFQPLRLNNVDENVAREIDDVLLKDTDKEEILRKVMIVEVNINAESFYNFMRLCLFTSSFLKYPLNKKAALKVLAGSIHFILIRFHNIHMSCGLFLSIRFFGKLGPKPKKSSMSSLLTFSRNGPQV